VPPASTAAGISAARLNSGSAARFISVVEVPPFPHLHHIAGADGKIAKALPSGHAQKTSIDKRAA